MAETRRRASAPRRAPLAPPAAVLPRLGIGCDLHPFDRDRTLVLGGVRIAGTPGLRGHSDADVLSHAVCDALLGALGLEDMGVRFEDTDLRWRGRSSLYFVRDAVREARRRGFRVGNLDAVVRAETPRLRPHLPAMRAALGRALGCGAAAVSVKAKRGEGLGWVGRSEGMAAQAVVLLAPAAHPAGATRGGGAPGGRNRARRPRAGSRRARARR